MKKILGIIFVTTLLFSVSAFAQDISKLKPLTYGACNRQATYLPKPNYPNAHINVSGLVNVAIRTNLEGNLIFAQAVSGHPLLRQEAEKAALKAKLKPSIVQGIPREVSCILVYKFNANERENIENTKVASVGIINKKALKLPEPLRSFIHLPNLKNQKEQIVAVQVLVDMSGNVIKADALTGHPLLRGGCEAAARQAKFPPILVDGVSINVQGLLIYKYQLNGEIETDITNNDKDVIGLPVNLINPMTPFCNCRFGSNPSVIVIAEIDEQGNVFKATAVSGHPLLRIVCEKAAMESKFLPINDKRKIIIKYNFEETSKWSVKFADSEIKEFKIQK